MKYKALWKDTFREIPKSIMRFLAILIIIFLGVGFYVGISATSPDMISTIDQYFEDYNLRDFMVQSTYGLTEEDAQTLGEMKDLNAQSQFAYDYYVQDYNQTIRLYGYDADNGQEMNQYHIAEGRLPESTGEIAIDTRAVFLPDLEIGDEISLEPGDSNGEPEESLVHQTFKVVGFVDTPLYITHTNRGFTTVGSGSLSGFGVILASDYDTEFYTETNLTVKGSQEFEALSEEYEEFIDPYETELTAVLDKLAKRRADSIQEEAQVEIDDGWAEIADAKQELADVEQELADARIELDDGWREYEDGLAKFKTEILAAEAEINRNEAELRQTISDLKNQRQELLNQRASLQTQLDNLDTAESELISGKSQLEDGIKQIEAGIAEIQSKRPEIEAGIQELDRQEAELNETRAQLVQALNGLNHLDAQMEQVEAEGNRLEENADDLSEEELIRRITENEAAQVQIRAQRETIEEAFDTPGLTSTQLEAQISAVDGGLERIAQERAGVNETLQTEQALFSQRDELQAQLNGLNSQEAELNSGRTQLRDGITQITDGIAQIDDGLEQASTGFGEIENARETLAIEAANAEAELANAEAELNDGEAEYSDGLATFESERDEALIELADAREELEQAEEDLANLAEPEYFATRRSEDQTYIEYKDNTDRLSIIAAVFPVFFFLIAVFISFTTMTRMVDEEREFIGITKALGYANRQILTKFITYSVLGTTFGVLFGLIAGYTLIPLLIFFAYGSMYNLPAVQLQQYTLYTVIATIAAFASTVGASMLAVKNSLRSNAAALLQPKAPKSGTHIWLEKIPFIWERLSFNYKITFRNVFRYKSRMFMTIFGIAGSTGLVLTGFGISDSISSIPDTQYTELNHFEAYVALNTSSSADEIERYVERIDDYDEIDDSILTFQEGVSVERAGVNPQDATIFVPMNSNELSEFMTLRHFETGELYQLDDSGAYITQKLARLFDVEIGDQMPILNADDEEWIIEIAGIVENYVGHTIYMNSVYFEEISGVSDIEPTLQLITYDTDTVDPGEIGRKLIDEDEVAGITYSTEVYDAFSDTLNSLDLITQILVVAAAALAFIVLYNLTNINVSERERELSTIKVLGFHDFEVTMYIYRENIILTFLGIFFGCLFGTVLQRFIMTTMEVDQLVFGKVIHLSSYIYSILLTVLFTLIVMVVIHQQLKRIDMVEALKAND